MRCWTRAQGCAGRPTRESDAHQYMRPPNLIITLDADRVAAAAATARDTGDRLLPVDGRAMVAERLGGRDGHTAAERAANRP